jgi:hypothetical protein
MDIITDNRSDSRSKNANNKNTRVLQVKQLFLQDSSRPIYATGGPQGVITRIVMEKTTFQKSARLVPGRFLLPQAKLAYKNVKKAMSIAGPLVDSNGDPKKSGERKEDVYKIVLDKMYELLKGRTFLEENLEGSDEEGKAPEGSNDEEGNSVRPNRWFFPGWMAFVLWGPLAPPSERNALTTLGDPTTSTTSGEGDSKSKYSRATQKKKDILEKAEERKRGGTDRGMTVMEKIGVARLHQVERQQQQVEKQQLQDKHNTRFIVHQSKVAIQRDMVKQAFEMYSISKDKAALDEYIIEKNILKQYVIDVEVLMASPPPPSRGADRSHHGAPDSTSLLSASHEKYGSKPTVLQDLLSSFGSKHVDASPEREKNNNKQQSNKAGKAGLKPPPPSAIVVDVPRGVQQEVEVEVEVLAQADLEVEGVGEGNREVEGDQDEAADNDNVSAGYSDDEQVQEEDKVTDGCNASNASSDSSGSGILWGKSNMATINVDATNNVEKRCGNSNNNNNNIPSNNNNNPTKRRKISISPAAVKGTAASDCPTIFLSSPDSSGALSGVSGGSISAASKRSIDDLNQLYRQYNWDGVSQAERDALLPFFRYHRLGLEEAIDLVEEAMKLDKEAVQKSRTLITLALTSNLVKGRVLPAVENPSKYALSSIQVEEVHRLEIANSMASFMDDV